MVASQSPCGCEKITNWPTPIQTSCFIGPYNLHYLLFSGIGTLLCHHPYYFCSQSSQTLFGIGAGQPKITAVVRCLFQHENTFDFAGGRGGEGGGVKLLSWALFRIHIFRDWWRSLLGCYNMRAFCMRMRQYDLLKSHRGIFCELFMFTTSICRLTFLELNVFFKVSRHFYDASNFIVAWLSPLRGQSFLS